MGVVMCGLFNFGKIIRVITSLLVFSGILYADVLSNGSFSQTWPIHLPPGSAGLTPQLALQYNTRADGKTISPGFEITGVMKIERLRSSRGIRYRGGDVYSGPHGKLVDISGNRTLFHSEIESFARYEPKYGTCGALPTEPCSWVMTTPDGMKFYFGTSHDSIGWHISDRGFQQGNSVRLWFLNKVEDLHGNFYTVNYQDIDGEPYINSIVYTASAGGGVSRYRSVLFAYESRNDRVDTYHDGARSTRRIRLRDIEVRSNAQCQIAAGALTACTMGSLVRRYRFSYDYSPETGRSRLVKFQEFGSNGIDAKPPVIFGYESTNVTDKFMARPLIGAVNFGALHSGQAQYYGTLQYPDLNGDGRADACIRDAGDGIVCAISSGAGFPSTIYGPALTDAAGFAEPRYYSAIRYPDINGDGKADICYRNSARIICAIGTGSGFGENIAGPAFSDAAGYHQPQYLRTLQYPDVNGDGRADICIRDQQGIECRLSQGMTFSAPFRGPDWSDSIGFNQPKYYGTITFVDINGDNMADICVRNSTGVICHLSTGSGFESAAITGPAWTDALAFDQPLYYASIRYTDLNRDGIIDVCARVANGLDCYFGTGSGFVPAFTSGVLADSSGYNTLEHVYSVQFLDLNADGIPEACARKAEGLFCFRGTGTGFGQPLVVPLLSDANGFNQDAQPYVFLDHNADGILDVCYAKTTGVDCFLSDTIYVDALITLQNSAGSITEIYYTTVAHEQNGIASTGVDSWPLKGNSSSQILVKRLSLSDGRGNSYRKRYEYENALIKWGLLDEIEDLGFRKIRETDEATGKFRQTFYIQNIADGLSGRPHIRHAGKIEVEHEYSGEGGYIRGLRNEYYENDATAFVGTRLSQISAQYIDLANGPRTVKLFAYDAYGNIKHIIDRADPTELIVTSYDYEHDLTQNILNRKKI